MANPTNAAADSPAKLALDQYRAMDSASTLDQARKVEVAIRFAFAARIRASMERYSVTSSVAREAYLDSDEGAELAEALMMVEFAVDCLSREQAHAEFKAELAHVW